jgi:phage tail tape-measure protein
MLTNDPARGSLKAMVDLAGVNGGKIARADVARFVVEQLATNTWLKQTPVLMW